MTEVLLRLCIITKKRGMARTSDLTVVFGSLLEWLVVVSRNVLSSVSEAFAVCLLNKRIC
jgi:hypothetical protein